MNFNLSLQHHALFAICSMEPECIGQEGWLPVMPSEEEQRRAHKIACARRYKTASAQTKATRRFARAFPAMWATATESVRELGCMTCAPEAFAAKALASIL